jgi:hypothetical protein
MGGLIVGLMIGGIAAYAYTESRSLQKYASKAKKTIKKATEGMRLPQPDFMVHLPNSAHDYATLDTVICECSTMVTPGLEGDELVVAVRDCVLSELYPDFGWPPIPGDHPTVEQLRTIIHYQVERSAAEGALCPQNK